MKMPTTKTVRAIKNSGSEILLNSGAASKLKTPLNMQTANTNSIQIDSVVAAPMW